VVPHGRRKELSPHHPVAATNTFRLFFFCHIEKQYRQEFARGIGSIRFPLNSRMHAPEAYVVVAVRWRVVVAIGATRVVGIVVPTAAANHAVGAFSGQAPFF
jgi:hypothetical protein